MDVTPLRVDLPYPSLEEIKPDLVSAKIISPAYAGQFSENTAIFQYIYHHFYWDSYDNEEFAKILEEISISEMIHLELLGETLLKLGVDPIFSNNPPCRDYFRTSNVAYSKTPQKMIMDDIASEIGAINDYQQMLKKLKNEQVAALIQRIVLDEMLHLETFKEMLNKINKNKYC